MKFSNFSVQYFCSYKKIKTITFLNSIIFKNIKNIKRKKKFRG